MTLDFQFNKRGVSLIEVIIIIAILAILAGIFAPLVYKTTETARYKRAQSELENLYNAILGNQKDYFGYLGDMGRFPNTLTELYIQGTQPNSVENPTGSGIYAGWRGPYISTSNNDNNGIFDPWGNYYVQVFNAWGQANSWMLVCKGKDGQFDNTDPNAAVNQDNLYYPDEPLKLNSYTVSGNTYYTIFTSLSLKSKILDFDILPQRVSFIFYDVRNGSSYQRTGTGNSGLFYNTTIGVRVIDAAFILDDGSFIGGSSVRNTVSLLPFTPTNKEITFSSTVEGFCNIAINYGGCDLPSNFSLNSSFNRNNNNCSGADIGQTPAFDVYFEGYNSSGEKIWGPVRMTKYSSSPHFRYSITNSLCGIKTLRFYSTGGGGWFVRNL